MFSPNRKTPNVRRGPGEDQKFKQSQNGVASIRFSYEKDEVKGRLIVNLENHKNAPRAWISKIVIAVLVN